MLRLALVLLLSVCTSASCAKLRTLALPIADAAAAPLVPLPRHTEWRDGSFQLTDATTIYFSGGGQYEASARFLAEHIGLALGAAPPLVEPAPGHIPDRSIVIRATTSALGVGAEGYELDVSPSRVIVTGEDSAGAFYGIQTLRQLLPPALEFQALRAPRPDPPPIAIPSVLIRDGPRFRWRGAMLDVARHFLPVRDVKRSVDLMALHKLNRLHLHLADDQGWRIEIRSWPNLAHHGGRTQVGGGRAASTPRSSTPRSCRTRQIGSSRSCPRSTCRDIPTRRSPRTPN